MAIFSKLKQWLPERFRGEAAVVPVVRLSGVIATGGGLKPKLSLEAVDQTLEKAFSIRKIAAVAVVINSPGGSPVQSALIHDRIRALASEKEVKVFTFCEDVAASGGYWLATAGDEIHANAASIIGSIGVVSAGFGFPEALKKLGIERRVHTAGEAKAILDPFQPEKKADVARLKASQQAIHELFKAHVKNRRGARLADDDGELFSGAFWTGEKAHELGLVDGIGDMHTVLKQKFGDKLKLKPVTSGGSGLLRRLALPGMARLSQGEGALAAGFADELINALESRALWRHYGL